MGAPHRHLFGDKMKIAIGQWIEIFRAGDYGEKGNYATADLDKIIMNFNGRVPIVKGHPESNSPARGWLNKVKRIGNVLVGQAGELHPDFIRDLAEGKFRNRSVRIARTPSGPKLLHLGFLGGVLPHVEGLKATASFAGGDCCADFGFRSGCDLAYKV